MLTLRKLFTPAVLALTLLAGPIAAQEVKPPAGVEFDPEALRLDVGLSVFLPVGSAAEAGSVGGKNSVATIRPKDNTWIINILTPRTANPKITTAAAVDEMVTQVLKDTGKVFDKEAANEDGDLKLLGFKGQIIEPRHSVVIAGLTAERVYLRIPGKREGIDPNFIRGYTVFRLTDSQFVTFELITTEPAFAASKNTYETVIAHAAFEDPTRAAVDRAAAIQSGIKVFERISEPLMEEIVAGLGERWERLYRPAPGGAAGDEVEMGYKRTRVRTGTRGDLNGGRSRTVADRQQGYIVQMDARFLDNSKDAPGRVVDVQAVYFMSFDRKSEAWTVSNAIRQGQKTVAFTEIGARDDDKLIVEITGAGQPEKTVRPLIQNEGTGYVSRVEAILLPQILIKAGITGDFGFYSFDSNKQTVRLRRELLEQPVDQPGVWRLTSRFSENGLPQVAVYNEKGELVRLEDGNGLVSERISFNELVAIWKRKNLPLK